MRFCNAALSGLALISLVASTACPQEDEPPSLEVTVAVPSLLRSGCIKVRQTWGDGTLTSTLGQAPSTNVAFTIRDAPEGVQSVTLEAVGYLDCHEVVRAEWGDPRTVEFPAAGPSKVQLELSHVDYDGDEVHTPEDCDDSDTSIPAEDELCTDSKDHDCDGAAGCADSACADAVCSDRGICLGGVCAEDTEGLCGDGVDNDQDGATDCADPDCEARSCDDGKACTQNDTCSQGECFAEPLCDAPPGPCLAPSGTCDQQGDCRYSKLSGTTCAGGTGICEDGVCGVIVPFGFQPANVDLDPSKISLNPALTLTCSAVVDTALESQSLCGIPVTGKLVSQPGSGPTSLVLAFRELNITEFGALRAVGPHPLILVVYGNATLDGPIDVGSSITSIGSQLVVDAGAGSAINCGNSVGGDGYPYLFGTVPGQKIWSGGQGGGFGGVGGNGGDVRSGSTIYSNGGGFGGIDGWARGSASLVPLVGGCAGGSGGTLDGMHGLGGPGGGAIELAVAGQLDVNGEVLAGGAGGAGGDFFSTSSLKERTGGGGGGSGGAVLLEADVIQIGLSARIVAHGGGGGAGGDSTSFGDNGDNGGNSFVEPHGGIGPGSGATGGSGAGPADGGVGGNVYPTTTAGGAGGGGGAAGRIRINAHTSCSQPNGFVSPAATFGGQTCE